MANTVLLTKEDGSKEEFDSSKLLSSLIRSGASQSTATKIVEHIEQLFLSKKTFAMKIKKPTASEVYKYAFAELKKMSLSAAARYSLRRSLMEFGPTGFPFEDYIAQIFKAKGYSTLTDQMVLGTCVSHEVDVVAWNNKKLLMAEVKYHNEVAGKTDLKVALYVKARFDDLKETLFEYGLKSLKSDLKGRNLDEGWLITNTKFSETALIYGNCSGLKMLSWNYPGIGNLQDLIEETKLHPLTCLDSLTTADKRMFLEQKVVLCKELYDNTELLKKAGFNQSKIFKVLEEISSIMNTRLNA